MRKVFLCSLFLGLVGSLLGADDPFAGTWKFNVAKSKPAPSKPGRAVKEQTMVIQETDDTASVELSGTREDASALSLTKYTVPRAGGPVAYTMNAPPAGVSVVAKRLDDRTVDFITMQDGKEVSTNHVTVSATGKTMRLSVKGVNAQGEPTESLLVFEKQ
jgi:hypothetical protein